MRPWVTLSPKVPHTAAGTRTDPPVSVPIEIGVIPAATAAPEPPEEPPAEVSVSQGLRTLSPVLVLRVEPEGPLVEVGTSDDHRPGLLQTGDAGSAVRRHFGVERRPACGDPTSMVDEVFQPDGDSGQRPDVLALLHFLIDGGGSLQGALVIDRDECVDGVLGGVSPFQGCAHPLNCGPGRHVGQT